jgi:hypothetical protein
MPLRGECTEGRTLGRRQNPAHSQEQRRTRNIPPRSHFFEAIDELDCDSFIGIRFFQQLLKIVFTFVESRQKRAPLWHARVKNALQRRYLVGGEAQDALDFRGVPPLEALRLHGPRNQHEPHEEQAADPVVPMCPHPQRDHRRTQTRPAANLELCRLAGPDAIPSKGEPAWTLGMRHRLTNR